MEIGAFSKIIPCHVILSRTHGNHAVTSLAAAHIADNYGRRMTLRTGAIVFTIGGAIQTFCVGYNSMVLGRIVSGFGVGMLSMVVPIYQVCGLQ